MDKVNWRYWVDATASTIATNPFVRHLTLIFKNYSIKAIGTGVIVSIAGKASNDNEKL